jgi:ribosomal protein S4
MSAPLGRIVDRHIKLFRYRSHPLVVAGDKLKEPLLHLVAGQTKSVDDNAKRRRQRSRSKSNKNKGSKKNSSKSVDASSDSAEIKSTYSSADGLECPKCGCDVIIKSGPRDKKCTICRYKWV